MRNKMQPKNLIPAWLSFSLAAAFVISGLTVTILAFLTIQEMLAAPLNPLDPFIAENGTTGDNVGVATLPPQSTWMNLSFCPKPLLCPFFL